MEGVASRRLTPASEPVLFKYFPLCTTPETESVRYLGFWVTPNGDIQTSQDLVFDRALKFKETIKSQPINPNMSWRSSK